MAPLFKKKTDESVHLVVFKDHLPSKTLEISMSWISRLGWTVFLMSAVTVGALGLAGRFYWLNLRSSPARVMELEKELADLRGIQIPETTAPESQASSTPAEGPSLESAGNPQETKNTPLAAPSAINPSWVNSFFPPDVRLTPNATAKSIDAKDLRLKWQNKSLKVTFNIQYILDDGGNQQGRIIILARGPSGIRTYPDGILSETASERALIEPDEGERFSVSRFRGVLAEFGPFENRSDLQSISVFLFDAKRNLLYFKKIGVAGEDTQ